VNKKLLKTYFIYIRKRESKIQVVIKQKKKWFEVSTHGWNMSACAVTRP
jgi:hypothetical protein